MRGIAFLVVLSIVLLSMAAFAGESATQAERNEVSRTVSTDKSGISFIRSPASQGSKAGVPGLMNYQGTLTDVDGMALDTTVSMTFSIYPISAGGTPVWTETQPAVVVSSGIFNVLLGSVNSIPDTVFKDPERWLGVQVGSDPELGPRQRLAAVGYAFRAAETDTAEYARSIAAGSDGDWIIAGDDMYAAISGNVGIGTTNPNNLLTLSGDPKISVGTSDGTDYSYLAIAGGGDAANWRGASISLNGNEHAFGGRLSITAGYDNATTTGSDEGIIVFFTGPGASGTERMRIERDGHIGVGTTSPTEKFDVGGNIHASGTIASGGSIVIDGINSKIFADTLELYVRPSYPDTNVRALRLEPAQQADYYDITPNIIIGCGLNKVYRYWTGAMGATISGGGSKNEPNEITREFGTIGGGYGNRVGAKSAYMGGEGGFIGGGFRNITEGEADVIGGGYTNTTEEGSGTYNVIGGGISNSVSAAYSTIGGGYDNSINAGWSNSITIAGGEKNKVQPSVLTASASTISGGEENTVSETYATIGGGYQNKASGWTATVGGGMNNEASGDFATIGGGISDTASGHFSTIAGGGARDAAGNRLPNKASGVGSTICGGYLNTASGNASTVAGGVSNSAVGALSFAAGWGAKANHNGCFVWADSTGADFGSIWSNEFAARAGGGMRVIANNGQYGGYFSNSDGGGDGIRAIANVSSGTNWGAVYAVNSGTSPAVYASGANAGYFDGPVTVTGYLTKAGGGFKIDHPLDPANKYLYHSFVESPDMKNVYDGLVMMDIHGEAWVELPEWFEAVNNDFRYQLTCIGGFAPVYVAEKISGNRFKIAGGEPGMEVSWQVTGIRQDAFADAHRIPVEEEKSGDERGKYLHPTEHGMSETAGIDYEARLQKEMR
jgi:hypothetical protein